MASNLVRVNLTLDRGVYQRLKRISIEKKESVSQLTRDILRRAVDAELAGEEQATDLVTRIRNLRSQGPPLDDSAPLIRASRDKDWS